MNDILYLDPCFDLQKAWQNYINEVTNSFRAKTNKLIYETLYIHPGNRNVQLKAKKIR